MENLKSDLHLIELFTQSYKEHMTKNEALRDIKCLQVQFPESFLPIEEGDYFAGRLRYLPIGFRSSENRNHLFISIKTLNLMKSKMSGEEQIRIDEVIHFWTTQTPYTQHRSTKEHFPNDILRRFDISIERLVNLGIQGLLDNIEECRIENPTYKFHVLANCMVEGLELLQSTCLLYANHARTLADEQGCEKKQCQLLKIAVVLESLTDQPPTNTREALQLVLLFSMMSGRRNMTHLASSISPFIDRDINLGRINKNEARCMFSSFIGLMNHWMPGQFGEFSELFEHINQHDRIKQTI